ncbi:MAG: pseudouridine synthase [Sandaracinaceae bacterium]
MAAERLQKILAHAGVASRRAAETLILDGRVRVNGRIVRELGTRAIAHKDKIEVDGRRIVVEKPVYYLVHKPREMVTTLSDPEGRAHLGQLFERVSERVYPVGRLDYHTSGAMLVTNDGKLTDALLNPKRAVPKVYVAKLKGHLGVAELDALRNGVELDDGYVTKKANAFVVREEPKNTWVQITLTEGKNRQIHRMAEAIGHPVRRLARTGFAELTTEGLRPGGTRPLTRKELERLEKNYLKPAQEAKARAAEERADEMSRPQRQPRSAPRAGARRPSKRRGPGKKGGTR